MALELKQKELYQHALNNKYIIPAFNCFDIESMRAIVKAAEDEDSPVVLQVCMAMHDKVYPLEKFISYAKDYLSDIKVPVILHHDHMQRIEDCFDAVDIGFPSVMFDGSQLPFEENVKKTKKIVEYAHAQGVYVEAELGSIPGFEDEVFSEKSVYTNPIQAQEFIRQTGCDTLSVAVGTAHGGVRADGPLNINFKLLQEIKSAVGTTPLVLHGAASLPKEYIDEVNAYGGTVEYLSMCLEETIEQSRHYGVAKANMDVDNFLKYTYTLRRFFNESSDQYNPFEYLTLASESMEEACAAKMRLVTKSSGFGNRFLMEEDI
jgi:fructose-bisphosphate aldolase class II